MIRFLAQLRAIVRDELNAFLAERYQARADIELRAAQSFEVDAELCRERAREWRNRAQVSTLLADDYCHRVAADLQLLDDACLRRIELQHHRDDDIVIPPFRFTKPNRAK